MCGDENHYNGDNITTIMVMIDMFCEGSCGPKIKKCKSSVTKIFRLDGDSECFFSSIDFYDCQIWK